MPKCHGIAANGKLQSPQGEREKTTVNPAVCFQGPCIHHHPLSPAFDGSITSPYCSCSTANRKIKGQSTGKSTGARTFPAQQGSSGQEQPETLPVCGTWCEAGILSPSFGCVSYGMADMGCRGVSGRLEQCSIKETSAVYSMRVFATFCLSSGAALPLYTPSSQSCLRCLHSNTIPAYTVATLLLQKAAK